PEAGVAILEVHAVESRRADESVRFPDGDPQPDIMLTFVQVLDVFLFALKVQWSIEGQMASDLGVVQPRDDPRRIFSLERAKIDALADAERILQGCLLR